jgi:hypothetical protein
MNPRSRQRGPSKKALAAIVALLYLVFAAPTYAQSVKTVTTTCAKTTLATGDTTTCKTTVRLSNGRFATNKTTRWLSGSPTVATVDSIKGLVRAIAAGTSVITGTVEFKSGSAFITVTGGALPPIVPPVAGDAELPRVLLNTAVSATPSNGRILRVVGSLQPALDSACSGDRIKADAGTVFSANFTIAPKSCGIAGEWITVEMTSGCPAEGTRVSPAMASALKFPRLVSPNSERVLGTSGPASRWRFVCIEFALSSTVNDHQRIITFGAGDAVQATLASVPSDLILDRSYIHGNPDQPARFCIVPNSARTSVVDSYVSECKSTFDASAIAVTNGPGPFKFVNNYLEGSTVTIMFGGADPAIPNLVPSDIEIRRNHITRQMAWRGKWLEKELIESKNSSHVLVEGNVLENTWVDGQYGWIMGLWSVNQDGRCTWCVTEHWTVRNNLIRNVTSGFSLSGRYSTASPLAHHISIINNLVIGLDNPAIQGYGRIFQIQNVPNLRIEHNTAFTPFEPTFSYDAGLMPNHIVRNNLVGGGQYQLFCGCGQGSVMWAQVAGPSSDFSGNVVALYPGWFNPIPNNEYPATLADIGLTGGATAAYSVTAQPTDLTLALTSIYKGKGTDGKDPGADIPAILAATQGVVKP